MSMKTYFKILAITAGLQIIGFFLTYCVDGMLPRIESSTVMPVFLAVFFIILSMVVGLVLSVKWFTHWKGRILAFLLLPINYTWLLFVIAAIKLVKGILGIMEEIPANFG